MEKPSWHKIEKNSAKPCPRWGHTCCVIDDEVVFFGGYADSNYMNDLWTYHATQRQWQEVVTTGQRPSHRSNCTINYDPQSNMVVVFGGGGPNKQRFNAVSVLDWSTKVWREIVPKENEPAPWERTYHVAELKYPYMVVFGGEGLADLDDLWVFDFRSERWAEVKMEKEAVRPCARRFHSSCLIGNEFFVIAGCHSKYRCLSDMYSLDLSPLLAGGEMGELRWVERKLKGASFLSRWGHSSAVFDGKIYVFAGRFSNDLNDLLVIDVSNNSLRGLKIGSSSDQPKPRRRHCAGFVGSCMVAFGGFNGEYFNDLFYINVFQLNAKPETAGDDCLRKHVGRQEHSDELVMTKEGEAFPIHRALISRYFKFSSDFSSFMAAVNGRFSRGELVQLMEVLYRGFGKVDSSFLSQYDVSVPETLNRRALVNLLLQEEPNQRNALALAHHAHDKSSDWCVSLSREDFQRFIQRRRGQWLADGVLEVGGTAIGVSKGLLSLQSGYFRSLFSGRYCEGSVGVVGLQKSYSPIVVEVVVSALMVGAVVVPVDYSIEGWMEVAELADYFCLAQVRATCESQLCSRVTLQNAHELELFAEVMGMTTLGLHCANQLIKGGEEHVSAAMERLKGLMRLQLSHSAWKEGAKVPALRRKGESETAGPQEKENNRQCSNV